MPQLFTNNARALLTASISDTATSITVETLKADLFPAANTGTNAVPATTDWFKMTLTDATGAVEIVYVRSRTAGSGVMSNVIRGREGTTARAWNAGTIAGLRITAEDVQASIAAAAAAVLTTGNQTIAGTKTFSATIEGSVSGNAGTVTNGFYTTGNQSAAGIKTWTGQQLWNGSAIHNMGNVVGSYTGIFGLGGRNLRKVTTGSAIEVVNQANSAVTHTLADNGDFSAAGAITAAGNVTAFSDERLKTDWDQAIKWNPMGLWSLANVKAGTYTRTDTGERQIGVSAQSLREVMPEAVVEDENGMLSVAYGNAALVACIALANEVMQLRQRVEQLEAR